MAILIPRAKTATPLFGKPAEHVKTHAIRVLTELSEFLAAQPSDILNIRPGRTLITLEDIRRAAITATSLLEGMK